MKYILTLLLSISCMIFLSCNEDNTKPKSFDLEVLNSRNYITEQLTQKEYTKNISYDAVIKSLNVDSIHSYFVINKDSISRFTYIAEMFEIELIDSIEFRGRLKNKSSLSKHLPLNSLLSIYFKDINKAKRNILTFPQVYNSNTEKGLFLKGGGIVFQYENMINIFNIDVCFLGYDKLYEADSILRHVLINKEFFRYKIGCGGVNIEKINN